MRRCEKDRPRCRNALFHRAAILFPLLVAAAFASADDQPQWGERFTRNMVFGEKGLPDRFDLATGKNVKWVAEIGTESHASPVISGGRVYIGTNNGKPRDLRQIGDLFRSVSGGTARMARCVMCGGKRKW